MPGDTIQRRALVERLSRPRPIVAITAGPGYGKTTLLRLWEHADPRRFVWIRGEDLDRSIADALDGTLDTPLVVVLDEPVWTDDAVRRVEQLVEQGPLPGMTVVLSGRALPEALDVRLTLRPDVLRVGEADLALRPDEAAQVLGPSFEPDDVRRSQRTTEGWTTGIRLIRAAVDQGAAASDRFTGRDPLVRSYVRAEILARTDAGTGDFLRAASAFPTLSAPLCDVALDRTDSAEMLTRLQRDHMFVRPLDREGRRFRLHELVREALAAELDDTAPGSASRLRRTAAEWLASRGQLSDAVPLLLLNGDRARALELIDRLVVPLFERGGIVEIVAMLRDIGTDVTIEDAYLATMLSYTGVMTGDEICAAHWAGVAERLVPLSDPRRDTRIGFLTLRAHRAAGGVAAMVSDAQSARALLTPADAPWRPPTLMLCGIAAALLGDDEEAARLLDEAIHFAEEVRSVPSLALSLTERAMLPDLARSPVRARALLDRAISIVESSEAAYPHGALAYAVRAQDHARAGAKAAARGDLARADSYRSLVGGAMPWLGIQLRLAIARAEITLGDLDGAGAAVADAADLLSRLPDAGVLSERVDALRSTVESMRGASGTGVTPLSPAELRMLPFLASHLSFEQIGRQLHLSKNTVKTQASSVYRKLGVSSRFAAVEQAERLGLLDAAS